MLRCENCGTLFTAELPGPASSHDYESYYHAGNLDVPEFVHGRLGELVRSFEDRRRLNRWLDVGCGAGTLMQAARQAGWDVVGTEVAGSAVDALRTAGFEVLVGELNELELANAGFDVVSVVEVVEHLPDPRALLIEAARHLRPGGVLYVTTPHARGISGRLLGTRWSVVAPPEHLQLFSVSGLRLALEGSGLKVRAMRTHAVNPSELIHAFRSRPALEGGSRVDASYRLNESLMSSRRGALVKRAANAALSATRLGDSIKVVAERRA
jgi:SAM-dependent methyltransferase